MAKAQVRFTREHTVIVPATKLESITLHNNERTFICDVPEKRFVYEAGSVRTFKSKKDALAFIKAVDGAAELI